MPLDYWAIELSAYAFFLFALVKGFRESIRWGATVLAAALTGFLIEVMFVHLAGGYEYGSFAVMIFGAPLWVACGWAFIIYFSMKASEALPVREWAHPFTSALMATGLDLALDPVAEGRGWWHWKREHAEFFGVSYDNFIGWLMIIGSFVGFLKLYFHLWGEDKRWKEIVFPLAAIPSAVVVVGGLQFLWEALYKVFGEGPVFLGLYLVFLAAGLATAFQWADQRKRLVMPVYFTGLLIAIAGYTGAVTTHPELYGVFALVMTTSVFWYAVQDA